MAAADPGFRDDRHRPSRRCAWSDRLGVTDLDVGTKVGSTVGWFLTDLLGNIVGAEAGSSTTITDAIRYDGYGQTLATYPVGGSAVSRNWKFQDRLDVSSQSLNPLYEAGARLYSPGTGSFLSVDSVIGQAQNPITLNRYLYAGANAVTNVDPSGDNYYDAGCDCVRASPIAPRVPTPRSPTNCVNGCQDLASGPTEPTPRTTNGPSLPSFVNPWALANDPTWREILGDAQLQCQVGTTVNDPGSCDQYQRLADAQTKNMEMFCAANAALCSEEAQLEQQRGSLAATMFLLSAATVVALAQPEVEPVLLAGDATTYESEISTGQQLDHLLALGEEDFYTIPATRLPGLTIIGHSVAEGGGYDELAQQVGARYFYVPRVIADSLPAGGLQKLDEGFINATIQNRDVVQLASPVLTPGGYFDNEVQQLLGAGYTWDPNGGLTLLPPSFGR